MMGRGRQVVLWGARQGDIVVGSVEDQRRQRVLKMAAAMRRSFVVGTTEIERAVRRLARVGTPANEAMRRLQAASRALEKQPRKRRGLF